MWVAIIILAALEVVQWIVIDERLHNIEAMNSMTIREMWRIVDGESMSDLRQDIHN